MPLRRTGREDIGARGSRPGDGKADSQRRGGEQARQHPYSFHACSSFVAVSRYLYRHAHARQGDCNGAETKLTYLAWIICT